jgi:uncharacterized membrane protein
LKSLPGAPGLGRCFALWLLAALFWVSGTAHFIFTATFASIIPPELPMPVLLVQVSGAAELALATSILVPVTRRVAGWGLIALMVAVFPANVYLAMHPALFPQLPEMLLWARLPLQGLLIGWAAWATDLGRGAS